MSSLTDSAAIFKYHRDMIDMYGTKSSYTLGWRDWESQYVRFKALSGIADLNGRSILDAGCGFADLLPFLQNIYPQIRSYCGIEQIPELLDVAVARYAALPGNSFISGNFITRQLPAADYVFASGSLNYSSVDPNFIFKAIEKLYESCKLGLGFNLLKKIEGSGLVIAYKPRIIFAYCRTLCDKVVIIDDYDEDDFTIFMYR